jgi:hypothetical protein
MEISDKVHDEFERGAALTGRREQSPSAAEKRTTALMMQSPYVASSVQSAIGSYWSRP